MCLGRGDDKSLTLTKDPREAQLGAGARGEVVGGRCQVRPQGQNVTRRPNLS